MKLRMTHNSIRIRIRKSELKELEEKGAIEESVSFLSGGHFRFVLGLSKTNDEVGATLENHLIKVILPMQEGQQWIRTNQVGIEKWNDLEGDSRLHILIEKDFPCVDREDEDKKDTFWELADKKPDVC